MDTLQLSGFIVIVHLINLLCLLLLIRSGVQILSDHPKLYWTDDTKVDNYWLHFGKKKMPTDRLWTSRDEAEDPGKLALPGGNHNLGSARHWHLTTALVWVVTGAIYLGYLFTTGQWQRLLPTGLGVFSRAITVMIQYLTLSPPADGATYNALQQLTYAGVVFLLAPLSIITGLMLSPALVARFPRLLKLFGGQRQVARSLHFIAMVLFSLFILVHITIAFVFHFYDSVKRVTLGHTNVDFGLALSILLIALILVVAFNIWVSVITLRDQTRLQRIMTKIYTPVVCLLFGKMQSKQKYTKADISPFFRVNGYPPKTTEYKKLQANDFKDWRLKVSGQVEKPLELSLKDIKDLRKHNQITKHNCIQGWSAVAQWGGLPMSDIVKLARPTKKARFVLFHCYDADEQGREYYTGLRLSDMFDAQTILAYEMNGEPLPIEHGAPLRLRCEKKYGYKMAKYIKSIEFVQDFAGIGEGRGGYKEDNEHFDWEATI